MCLTVSSFLFSCSPPSNPRAEGKRNFLLTENQHNSVRMLLKSGHRQIYLSRQFAIKHGFLPKKFGAANGGFAYAGILPLPGPITLTIGSRTSAHKAYVTEENKFDVILGRAWIEKMGVKWVFILLIFRSFLPTPADMVIPLKKKKKKQDRSPRPDRPHLYGYRRTDRV